MVSPTIIPTVREQTHSNSFYSHYKLQQASHHAPSTLLLPSHQPQILVSPPNFTTIISTLSFSSVNQIRQTACIPVHNIITTHPQSITSPTFTHTHTPPSPIPKNHISIPQSSSSSPVAFSFLHQSSQSDSRLPQLVFPAQLNILVENHLYAHPRMQPRCLFTKYDHIAYLLLRFNLILTKLRQPYINIKYDTVMTPKHNWSSKT